MAFIMQNPKQQAMFRMWNVHIAGGKVKGKAVWWLLQKLNKELSYDPAVPFLGIYPRSMKTYGPTETYTWLSMTATIYNSQKGKPTQLSASG